MLCSGLIKDRQDSATRFTSISRFNRYVIDQRGRGKSKVFAARSDVKVKVSAGSHSKAFDRTLKRAILAGLFKLRERHQRKVQAAGWSRSSRYLVGRRTQETKDGRRRRSGEAEKQRGRESDKGRSVTVKQWRPSVPLLPKHLVHVNQ